MCKYADDCTASESIPNGELSNMQKVLDGLQNLATTNNMLLNSRKTKECGLCGSRSAKTLCRTLHEYMTRV